MEEALLNVQKMKMLQRGALDIARTRLLMASAVFVFAILAICGRLFDLTILRSTHEPTLAEQDLSKGFKTGRAEIVDRVGNVLATTITTSSLYANARVIQNYDEVVKKLRTVLPAVGSDALLKRLQSKKSFIWIARHLTPQQKEKVLRLGIPGLNFMSDQRRIYPHGSLVSHILGVTNVDNQGIAGIEKSMDSYLTSNQEPLQLSVDLRVQHIVRDELVKGVAEFNADGAAGMLMDIKTGEVVAMVSLPDFNPNHPNDCPKDNHFNKLTLGTYEMGSTMKAATIAMALEYGVAKLSTVYDVTHPIHIGRFKITDNHPKGRPLNVAEIFVYSSNIGAAQLALATGISRQKEFLKSLGLFEPSSIELKEIGVPLVPRHWRETTAITVSYGYGMSITPLHLVSSIATLAGGGTKVMPTLLRQKTDLAPGVRVISQENSRKILQLMRHVVSDGTARKANVPEYFVAVKTGTRKKLSGRGYSDDHVVTTLVGVVGETADTPKYVIFVMIDDPKASKQTYGFNAAGWNAAVVTKNIISRMGPVLGMMPNPIKEMEDADPFFRTVSFGGKH